LKDEFITYISHHKRGHTSTTWENIKFDKKEEQKNPNAFIEVSVGRNCL
jgi:hypothetical protein